MAKTNWTHEPEYLAQLRARKGKNKKPASENAIDTTAASERDNKTIENGQPRTPFIIRSLKDIDKVTRDMMTSLANKDGRFTVAEVRVFSTLVSIFKSNRETMKSEASMRQLLKEHKENTAGQQQ